MRLLEIVEQIGKRLEPVGMYGLLDMGQGLCGKRVTQMAGRVILGPAGLAMRRRAMRARGGGTPGPYTV